MGVVSAMGKQVSATAISAAQVEASGMAIGPYQRLCEIVCVQSQWAQPRI
jgi:hypothetical protein